MLLALDFKRNKKPYLSNNTICTILTSHTEPADVMLWNWWKCFGCLARCTSVTDTQRFVEISRFKNSTVVVDETASSQAFKVTSGSGFPRSFSF